MFEMNAGFPVNPLNQRYRDYARQRQMTLADLLLENRIIFLDGPIHDGNANLIVMKLLYLQSENKHQDIHFYINSPGGSVTATLAIYDTMAYLEPAIATYCVGLAASGAAVLMAGGEKGKRFILPHAGGLVPYFSWRLSVSPMIDPRLRQLTQDEVFALLKRFWYDNALSPGAQTWGCLANVAPPDQIVFGSDWPFANARVTAAAIRTYEALAISPAQRAAIDRGNALPIPIDQPPPRTDVPAAFYKDD